MPERQGESAPYCAVPQVFFAVQRAKNLQVMMQKLQPSFDWPLAAPFG
jgi:hypothetical protein